MGGPNEAPGAAAEFCRAAGEKLLSAFPNRCRSKTAVLVEPLSVGLHAVRLGDIRKNAAIAILGAGPIGLSVLLCAKAVDAFLQDLHDRFAQRAVGSGHRMRGRLDRHCS